MNKSKKTFFQAASLLFAMLFFGQPGPVLAQAQGGSYLARVNNAMQFKKYHYAVDLSSQEIRKNPKSAEAYFFRACANATLQQSEQAVADYEKGAAIHPCAYPSFMNEIAKSYIALDQYDKAMALLDATLKIQPFSDSYRSKGQILMGRKQTAQALVNFDQALKISPHNYWCYDDRSKCYLALGRLPDALKDINKMIEMQPTDTKNYINRAALYDKMNNKAAAKIDREKAIKLSPQEWF